MVVVGGSCSVVVVLKAMVGRGCVDGGDGVVVVGCWLRFLYEKLYS